MNIILSQDQKEVFDFAVNRLIKKEPLTTIGGYAGCGKTILVGEIVKEYRRHSPDSAIAFVCYTGKAKNVLAAKLKDAEAFLPCDFIGTIHSFLFSPIFNYKKDETEKSIEKIVTFQSKEVAGRYACVVIDEASMVSEEIFSDIQALNIPILAVGDHAQLPPIMSSFNLMENPMIRLEKIHRQAESNPIISLSMMAREEGRIPFGDYSLGVIKTDDGSILSRLPNILDWTLLCGTNRKRVRLNAYMRQKKFVGPLNGPMPGDKVICLQNNYTCGIFNGMTGKILRAEEFQKHWYASEIDMDDFIYHGNIFKYQFNSDKTLKKTVRGVEEVHPDDFGDLFDYGYCCTVHKFQGSETENVILYEEKGMKRFLGEDGWRRWLYTGVTRAKNQLIIIGE